MHTNDSIPINGRIAELGESERATYLRGIELFNQRRFFEAHEEWEEIWRASGGPRRSFYQGLIQCAVALEHFRRSNPRGVISLHGTYPKKFDGLPRMFLGIDVPGFLAAMEQALRPITFAHPLPAKGKIQFDLSSAPMIRVALQRSYRAASRSRTTSHAAGGRPSTGR